MASPSRKRAPSPDETDLRSTKRQRTSTAPSSASYDHGFLETFPEMTQDPFAAPGIPSEDEQMRSALQRSIALALDHVGFASTHKDALESLTSMAEECMYPSSQVTCYLLTCPSFKQTYTVSQPKSTSQQWSPEGHSRHPSTLRKPSSRLIYYPRT